MAMPGKLSQVGIPPLRYTHLNGFFVAVMHKKAHLRIDVVRKLWDELAGRSESNLSTV